MEFDRRDFLAGIGLGVMGTMLSGRAAAATIPQRIQRELSMEMARAYELRSDKPAFRRLYDVQDAFRKLGAWPNTQAVVDDAMSVLTRVLEGEPVDRDGFRTVRSVPSGKLVVFSDHHIMPSGNRQSGVWRANRDGYTKVLRHYGDGGWVVAENGDVEDLVILEPAETVRAYEAVLAARTGKQSLTGRSRKELQAWFRSDPLGLVSALRRARAPRRQEQLDTILAEPGNAGYYGVLADLANGGQLVRVAGNHDYGLQSYDVDAHLVPVDVLLFGGGTDTTPRRPFVVMHGHQFDQATNPGVAALYGEVISECLGVWYQGPDRSWSDDQVQRILTGGFPNRLATHRTKTRSGLGGAFAAALLTGPAADDEEWAAAWEGLFGHPIAWEYGAEDWAASVRGAFARPGRLVDDAMLGRQFFKFRHLDEAEIVRGMARWNIRAGLVLGHSHEVRHVRAGPVGRYANSGAAGRFEKLLWALEINNYRAEVVAWHVEPDGACQRYVFTRRDAPLFSYFEPAKSGGRIA